MLLNAQMAVECFSDSVPWYSRPAFRRRAVALLLVILAVEGGIAVFRKRNDFNCHLAFGQAYLAGEPYRAGGNYYPLGRACWNAGLASMPYYAARFIVYAAAVASLVFGLTVWTRLDLGGRQPVKGHAFAAATLAVLILLPLLLRDLDECGLQLVLLGMLAGALWALARRRRCLCGLLTALAATYKLTPILFLPYLLWKREWRAAGWCTFFLVVFNMAPALHLGWERTVESHRLWACRTWYNLEHMPFAYPSVPLAEIPQNHNLSLRAGVARYIETYPAGHPLHLDHAGFVQFGAMRPQSAKLVVTGVLGLLAMTLAWRMRRPHRSVGELAGEWAVVTALCALLSPICWKQHLVLVLPCVLLLSRRVLPWTSAIAGVRPALVLLFAIVWAGRRDLIGDDLSQLWLSYKLETAALLTVVLVSSLLTDRSRDLPVPLKLAGAMGFPSAPATARCAHGGQVQVDMSEAHP